MSTLENLRRAQESLSDRLNDPKLDQKEVEVLLQRIDALGASIKKQQEIEDAHGETCAIILEKNAAAREHDAHADAVPDELKIKKRSGIWAFLGSLFAALATGGTMMAANYISGQKTLEAVQACGEETSKNGYMHNERLKVVQIAKK